MLSAFPLAMVLLVSQVAAPPPVPTAGQAASASAAEAAQAAASAAQSAALAADAAARAAQAAVQAAGSPGSPPVAPAPSVPPAITHATGPSWSGLFGANVIWLQGNSNTLTYSANLALTRTFQSGWIVSGKASGIYGQTQAAGAAVTQVNALAGAAQLRADKVIVPETSIYLLGGAEGDHIASLELRYYGEVGDALYWFDRKEGTFQKLLLRTDIGFRAARDDRWQYYPIPADPTTHSLAGLTFLGPRFAGSFRYALNKDVIFTQDASILENIDGQSRTLVNAATKLSSRIVAHVSFAVTFLLAYDSEPAAGKVPTDTALTIGLEGSF